MSDEETFRPVNPDDAEQQTLYLHRLQWKYPKETGTVDAGRLLGVVREGLRLCPTLRINDPSEILRFLALSFLLTPDQKRSAFLGTIVYRILLEEGHWRATKRLNFIYKFVVGRPPPDPEPEFGPWFVEDSRVTYEELSRVVLADLNGPPGDGPR